MKSTRVDVLWALQTLLFLGEVLLLALFCASILPRSSGIWSALCAIPIVVLAITMVVTCMVPILGQYTQAQNG